MIYVTDFDRDSDLLKELEERSSITWGTGHLPTEYSPPADFGGGVDFVHCIDGSLFFGADLPRLPYRPFTKGCEVRLVTNEEFVDLMSEACPKEVDLGFPERFHYFGSEDEYDVVNDISKALFSRFPTFTANYAVPFVAQFSLPESYYEKHSMWVVYRGPRKGSVEIETLEEYISLLVKASIHSNKTQNGCSQNDTTRV